MIYIRNNPRSCICRHYFSGKTTGVLKQTIINLSKTAEEVGLAINLQRSKYMKVT
jgi:hypothetical protein